MLPRTNAQRDVIAISEEAMATPVWQVSGEQPTIEKVMCIGPEGRIRAAS
jgi:hypothetical protein